MSTLLGLVSVALLTVGSGRGWAPGAVMILLMGGVYTARSLYASAVLQIYFLATQYLGWKRWKAGAEEDLRSSARRLSPNQWAWCLVAFGPATLAGVQILSWMGGASVWLDSFVTSGSLVAQTLMVLGFGECWLWWLVVDVAYVYLMARSGLYGYTGLYAVYCVLALKGWREWTRDGKPS